MRDTLNTGCGPGQSTPEPASHDVHGLVSLGTAGADPASLSPHTRDEAPAGDTAQGFRDQGKTDSGDCAQAHDMAQRKRQANLQASLALKGLELRQQQDGSFLVSRWNLTRELRDLSAVESFARQVGAAA